LKAISHYLLLQKLKTIIGYNTLWFWFKSYLYDGSQTVRINDAISDLCTVKYGISQGPVLGPILFSIYVNDLLNLDIEGNILAFADDTVLFFEGDNWAEVEKKANLSLTVVSKWYSKTSLMLNNKKSVFIPFT